MFFSNDNNGRYRQFKYFFDDNQFYGNGCNQSAFFNFVFNAIKPKYFDNVFLQNMTNNHNTIGIDFIRQHKLDVVFKGFAFDKVSNKQFDIYMASIIDLIHFFCCNRANFKTNNSTNNNSNHTISHHT